jgi:hypothetical protein
MTSVVPLRWIRTELVSVAVSEGGGRPWALSAAHRSHRSLDWERTMTVGMLSASLCGCSCSCSLAASTVADCSRRVGERWNWEAKYLGESSGSGGGLCTSLPEGTAEDATTRQTTSVWGNRGPARETPDACSPEDDSPSTLPLHLDATPFANSSSELSITRVARYAASGADRLCGGRGFN